jgi:hypothetical protein
MSSSTRQIDRSAERRSAPRVPIRMRVRYREPGDGEWIEGLTENISRSGILFRGQPIGEPRAALEMIVILPETAQGPGGRALCDGHIVRLVSKDGSGPMAFAAKISSYRFVGRVAQQGGEMPEWPAVLADAADP